MLAREWLLRCRGLSVEVLLLVFCSMATEERLQCTAHMSSSISTGGSPVVRTAYSKVEKAKGQLRPTSRTGAICEGTRLMPLTRGEAVGYDADLMAFKFTMKNGQQIVQCQISRAALVDLAGRSTGVATRDLPAQFEAHRELIEAIASAEFDQIGNEETRLVRIFAKHIPSNPTQK